MKIFLIGFMGAGKSVIGKRIANLLNFDFFDLDQEIEKKYKMSIESIFEKFGETCFRNLETIILKTFADKDNFVLACGGGTPCFNDNMNFIKNSGTSIYIELNEKVLYNRITNSHKKRPLVSNKNENELLNYITKTLEERKQFYNQAEIKINGLDFDAKKIVKEYFT